MERTQRGPYEGESFTHKNKKCGHVFLAKPAHPICFVASHLCTAVHPYKKISAQSYPLPARTTWRDYGGTSDSAQYSALRQINRTNVSKLKVAWTFPTGDRGKYLFNPIVIDRVMYVLAEHNSIIALDAASGKQLWTHATDPKTTLITYRGINYWESPDRSDRRLLFAANNFLQEIDARTGKSIQEFGDGGRVDLRDGLGRDPKSLTLVQSTIPGRVFEDLIILGSATNEEYDSGPGDIRAYNVRSGKLAWSSHTIPHSGRTGIRHMAEGRLEDGGRGQRVERYVVG